MTEGRVTNLVLMVRTDREEGLIVALLVDESENRVMFVSALDIGLADHDRRLFDCWKQGLQAWFQALTGSEVIEVDPEQRRRPS